MKISFLAVTALLMATSTYANSFSKITKVIYGTDSRHEAQDYPRPEMVELSQSVAAMVPRTRLTIDRHDPSVYNFSQRPATDSLGLCADERFSEQVALASCTGFLVAPDIIVTAGHCVESEFSCRRNTWVFDYLEGTEQIEKDNVYHCAELIESQLHGSFDKLIDYAIVRLDRPVTDRLPLEFRTQGQASLGRPLIVAGYPSGMPLKIANEAKVSRMNTGEILNLISTLLRKRYYFSANLDTYGGNSGSPVFDAQTLLVEGILVEGAEDYFYDKKDQCLRSNVRSGRNWSTEEKVFRITQIPYLKRLGIGGK